MKTILTGDLLCSDPVSVPQVFSLQGNQIVGEDSSCRTRERKEVHTWGQLTTECLSCCPQTGVRTGGQEDRRWVDLQVSIQTKLMKSVKLEPASGPGLMGPERPTPQTD